MYKSIIQQYDRNSIFNYKLSENIIPQCRTISWFASKTKAEYYKRKNSNLYSYKTKRPLFLFVVNNYNNYNYFSQKTEQYNNIQSLRCITDIHIENIPLEIRSKFEKYEYLYMNKIERVIFEYGFAFGLLNVKEQIQFFKLILKLQEYRLIEPLNTMMTVSQENFSPNLLRLFRQSINIMLKLFLTDSEEYNIGNRFSIYSVDINVVQNLCILLDDFICGYIYLHQPSIWHRKMTDTSEIAIFNPVNYIE